MKSVLLILLISVFAFAGSVTTTCVDTVKPTVTVVDTAIVDTITKAVVAATGDTAVNGVAVQIKSIINATRKAGGTASTLLILSAIISLLVSVMKLKVVAKYLNTAKMKNIKPYIALIIGMLSGIAASLSTGQSLVVSVISGLAAGFGSIGIYETSKAMRKNA
ncbi:MAG: hypothetical protein Q7R33_05290 [Nitrosarchaeum sp.]|nr:hypothetical protein [Nitrosarchaeum sp.]